MRVQKLKLEKGIHYNKSAMYWFDHSMDIPVEEEQPLSNTLDRVILHYTVRDGDKAYFSKEYIPDGMLKEGTKRPDITAALENSAERRVKWYIYDIKGTVIHAETALKLCSQWHSGIGHIAGSYLNGLDGYSIEGLLGVITRYWDRDMLQKEQDAYKEKINQAGHRGLLTARKSRPNLDVYRQKVKAIQFILDGIFVDNEASGEEKSYDIHYVCMTKVEESTYTAEMDIIF